MAPTRTTPAIDASAPLALPPGSRSAYRRSFSTFMTARPKKMPKLHSSATSSRPSSSSVTTPMSLNPRSHAGWAEIHSDQVSGVSSPGTASDTFAVVHMVLGALTTWSGVATGATGVGALIGPLPSPG